jgi:transposase InsO family protein
MDQEWVALAEFPSRDAARIVAGMLRANEVMALTRFDDAGGAYPQLAARAHGGTSVLVQPEDLERARRLVTPAPWPEDEPLAIERRRRLRRRGLVLIMLIWGVPMIIGLIESLAPRG